MTYVYDDLEVVILQRSRRRFEWHLCDRDGAPVAKGRATSVAQARLDGLRSRSQKAEPVEEA